MSDRFRTRAFAMPLVLIALGATLSFAQPSTSQNVAGSGESSPPYQPAVPNAPEVYGGGYGGYYSPGTVAGSRAQGMASVVQAAGSYNLATSAAAVNMTQAQKQQIQNYDSYVNTYFDMRQVNKQARAAERGPRLSEADLVRISASSVPKPLPGSQLDPVTGKIAWPGLLQDDKFAEHRAVLDQAFEVRARYGALPPEESKRVRAATDAMLAQLKHMVRDVDGTDYAQSKRFVQSLAYQARTSAA
jgi:hypothetical protein